ncbi:MAG: ACT domain-containing protein [Gammaproteobacteria bacterium]|nr:ACT domain-containing protein [Gammaproteobacteria bacterium]
MNEKLYIIFGTGRDSVGLVQKITTPISAIRGNIIDLRQDVLHGLFTVFMVVDLAEASVSVEEVQSLVSDISEETGLDLTMDRYQPVARSAEKRNMLMILLGRDKAGIIAAVADILQTYNINIEFSDMVAREDIFLMELMVDIRHCAIPLENLQEVLRERMGALGINTLFQSEDVFNKKKRILLFDIRSSFIDGQTMAEVLQLTGISLEEFKEAFGQEELPALQSAARCLEDLPVEVAANIARAVVVTPETMELIQTLKIMGYKIALVTRSFTCLSEILQEKLALDHCFGVPLVENDDAMTLTGELEQGALRAVNTQAITEHLADREGVSREDITIIADQAGDGTTQGLHIHLDMKILLDYYNQHILSREALIGLLGSFGIPVSIAAETSE